MIGSDTFPVRRFAVVWTACGGYVLGTTGLLLFDRDAWWMLLLGFAPAIVSVIGVAVATRRAEGRRALRIIVASTVAATAMPLLLGATAVLMGSGNSEEVALLVVLAGMAALAVAPLGAAFGAVYAGVYWQLDESRRFGRSAFEQLWMRFGGASIAQGAIVLGLAAVMSPTGSAREDDLLVPLGVGGLVFGALTAARGVLIALRRRRLAERVRRGEMAGWAILPRHEFGDTDELPELFGPFGQEVLARHSATTEGPFRSSEGFQAVAKL